MTSIIVEAGNSKYDSHDNCNAIIETSRNVLITGCKNTIIPNSVTSIGSYAFSGCTTLTSVSIPNSVTSIGDSAFESCTSLTSVIIPESVTIIGERAFFQCTGLMNINIPNNVTNIGKGAFHGCRGLTSITIPNNLTNIEDATFSGCTSLKSITIPNGVTSIGAEAFDFCSGLTNIIIPSSVMTIGQGAFQFCGLTSVTVPGNVTNIEANTFSGCKNLKSIIIPGSVIRIGQGAFQNCTNLTSFSIPNNVTNIEANTFYGCTNLDSITLHKSVTTIGNGAFARCSSLKCITIPNYVTSFGKDVFPSGCNIFVNKDHISLFYLLKEEYWNKIYDVNTNEPLPVKITPTTIEFAEIGDSINIVSSEISINGILLEEEERKVTGMDPNHTYTLNMDFTYRASSTSNNGTYYYNSRIKLNRIIYMASLTLTTLQPKVISVGNVIVAAESNLDDEETSVGFEWRRTDWTDDFASNTGGAYLYEGTMEGYIRNLNAEKLWKYRPYYESNAGNRYYGDWIGIDPSNTSYFEPTVHTYASISVNGNTASVRGYAQRGTDNITTRGFKYWENTAEARGFAPSNTIPKNAATVETTGTVMEAELIGLSYETTYSYVAFVTTSEGETFYGDVRQFTTGSNPTGINITTNSEKTAIPTTYYDINGQRHNQPQPGLNIIRFSDGTSRKIFLK